MYSFFFWKDIAYEYSPPQTHNNLTTTNLTKENENEKVLLLICGSITVCFIGMCMNIC